jgi:NADH:ubiquinone reductase (H+-translocating)
VPAQSPYPRLVVLGCSFAGLELVYRYARRRGRLEAGELTVVEPRLAHPYIPLAHEAISGARTPAALAFDQEQFCTAVGATFVRASALAVDPARRLVRVDGEGGARELTYDRLVVAVGSVAAVPGAFAASPRMIPSKFVADALRLRDRVRELRARGSPARVAVVGAGITGVEWGAELAGSGVDGEPVEVVIVGRERELLPQFRRTVARHAERVLARYGVRLVLGRSVTGVGDEALALDGGEHVPCDVVLWAGGVRPNPAVVGFGLPLAADGHVVVTPRLAVPGHDGVYAAGDVARIVGRDGTARPTMERAIEAIWQGAYLARRLADGWRAEEGPAHRIRRDFFYGLSLGRRNSVVLYGRFWFDVRLNVYFRRWLQWAYYERFRLLGRLRGERRSVRPEPASAAAD